MFLLRNVQLTIPSPRYRACTHRIISQDVFCRNPSLRFVRKRHLERIRLAASEKKNFELL